MKILRIFFSDGAQERRRRCAIDRKPKISGPLFDRIDPHVDVPAVRAADLTLPPPAESSSDVVRRVALPR